MPLTRAVGFDGNVTLGTHNLMVKAWSCDFDSVVTDTTVFGESFRSHRGGVYGGSGSLTCVAKFDTSSTTPDAFNAARRTGVALTLQVAAGCTYSGNAVVSNISFSTQHDGEAVVTLDFVFTGTITETWDQSG